jgi:hypothetical protein
MPDVPMPVFDDAARAHFLRMVQAASSRDHVMNLVKEVRRGNMRQLFPLELNLNLTFEGVPIANHIDTVAKDMSELIAPLPSLACVSGKMKSDADLERAEIKNRVTGIG